VNVPAPKRILIADDHLQFLEYLRTLLGEDYEIAGAVENGQALADAAQSLKPDLIISDISMPVMTGFEAASKIRSLGVKTKLIFLSVISSPAYVKRALSLGASGYVLKVHAQEQLLTAVSKVLDGGTFVSPEVEIRR
jgi:DNA-binding NarL/FixJ family response regulator